MCVYFWERLSLCISVTLSLCVCACVCASTRVILGPGRCRYSSAVLADVKECRRFSVNNGRPLLAGDMGINKLLESTLSPAHSLNRPPLVRIQTSTSPPALHVPRSSPHLVSVYFPSSIHDTQTAPPSTPTPNPFLSPPSLRRFAPGGLLCASDS